MNNKILIGSIIAVTTLIGVSFTSVVGYRSGASDVKASPLFNIRSSRAIDEESEEVSINYLGKGNRINIHLPVKDNKVILLDRFVNNLSELMIQYIYSKLESYFLFKMIEELENEDS